MSSFVPNCCARVSQWPRLSAMDLERETVDDLDYEIGDRVNTLMRRQRHTRQSLGAILGIGPSAMSMKLSGRRTWTARDVKVAAHALEVTVGVLYGEEPMPRAVRLAVVGGEKYTPRDLNPEPTD
jgi:hypothetical protein